MWECPLCHHKFYNKNQSHSCGLYSVDLFLKGKSPKSIELFHYFLKKYKEIGEFELHPVKTRVALLTLMRFASVNKLGKDFLSFHLVLTASYEKCSCFYKVENLSDRFFVHHTKLFDKKDITEELMYYMKLAYHTGMRLHIK